MDALTEQDLREDEIDRLVNVFFSNIELATLEECLTFENEPDWLCGLYKSLEKAQEVCCFHPEFHIISMTKTDIFNKPVVPAKGYFLGKGDRDPSLRATRPQPSLRGWQKAYASFVKDVGPNPTDPEDAYFVRLLRMFAGGENWRDASLIRKAREVRQDQ